MNQESEVFPMMKLPTIANIPVAGRLDSKTGKITLTPLGMVLLLARRPRRPVKPPKRG